MIQNPTSKADRQGPPLLHSPWGHLGVGLYFKVVITKVTFHPELEDGRGVVTANGRLLCIVADTHTYVGATPTTPDVVRQFKPEWRWEGGGRREREVEMGGRGRGGDGRGRGESEG